MEPWQLLLLAVLGLIAGVINTIAGGGSLLTLPAMVLMGMDGPDANGSNRVAVLAQNMTAVSGFHARGFSDFKLSLTLSLASLPGAIAGAFAGTLVRGVLFNRILAVIMILILVQMAVERHWRKSRAKAALAPACTVSSSSDPSSRHRLIWGHLWMVGVGFYGGFIQAGVGFLLMAVLHQGMGLDLVRVNMHKVFIVGVFTLAAMLVFLARGHVLWIPGLTLAIGNGLGGWVGAHLSVSKGETFIRRVLYVTLIVMAVKLLWNG